MKTVVEKKEEIALDTELRVNDRNNEEKVAALFEPDFMVAHEYERVYGKRTRSPEEQLMAAVLEEAIADFQRCLLARDKKRARRFAEAEAWLVNQDDDWICSFASCCSVLGIEADYLRQGLLDWKQKKLAAPLAGQLGSLNRACEAA